MSNYTRIGNDKEEQLIISFRNCNNISELLNQIKKDEIENLKEGFKPVIYTELELETENKYIVNVGNIGNIQESNKKQALKTYKEYVEMSKSNTGRAGGESVVLFVNDEIEREYIGTLHKIKEVECNNISQLLDEIKQDEIDNLKKGYKPVIYTIDELSK